jgi:hypothetical protein
VGDNGTYHPLGELLEVYFRADCAAYLPDGKCKFMEDAAALLKVVE